MAQSLQQIYDEVLKAYRSGEVVRHRIYGYVTEGRRDVFINNCIKIIDDSEFSKQLMYDKVREEIEAIVSRSKKTSALVSQISHLIHDIESNPRHSYFEDRDQGELF